MRDRLPLAPAEGWLTVGCVVLICVTMAWVIDDARWVLGQAPYLDHLVVLAIGGVLAGFIGPKVGWGRWRTFLIGAIFAALVIPLFTGAVAHPSWASLHELFEATAASVVAAYIDLALRDQTSTPEYLHFIWAFGLLVWTTAMFASYAVFGHRRPLSAVVAVGLVVVGNMTLTENDELPFLVLFSIGSLFLLIRSHVFDEQTDWIRRRIGDPASVSAVYLRGGTTFIAVAVALAFLLTMTAASAPLAGAWDGVEDGLIGISQSVQRFLPTGGSNRSLGVAFGPDDQVRQKWTTSGAPAVSIQRDPLDEGHYYWRATTYDKIGLRGWSQSGTSSWDVAPGGSVFEQLADDVAPEGRHEFTFSVTPLGYREPKILAPATPVRVDGPARLLTVGADGFFVALERDGGESSYTVTALTEVAGNDAGEFNLSALRAAGEDYPAEIARLYLGMPGPLGPNARALEDRIVAAAETRAPIDLANAIVAELHDPSRFTYSVDVTNVPCEGLSTVECFATYRTGFCQYYAATMAVLLRDLGVPTRIVGGFLPGTIDPTTGTEIIAANRAHNWVEVYFPGFGWKTFDPTGGSLSEVEPLPSGHPQPSATPRPLPSIAPASRKPDLDDPSLAGGPSGAGGSRPSSPGPFVAVGVLLALVVGILAFVVWQRGPRGPTTADGAFGRVTRIASRLGFAPRPAQTVYEYAGSLGDILPGVRPELETVARARVESVYARRLLGEDRLESLRAAERRLRVQLLRLAFRRSVRRRRP